MYSLGEVVGPSMGGFLLQYYGFPLTATVMAAMTLVLVLSTLFFNHQNSFIHSVICLFIHLLKILNFFFPPQLQAFIVSLFFCIKSRSNCGDCDNKSESDSWKSSNDETSPLLSGDSNHRQYTEEKVQYYEQSRKQENEVV